MDGRWEKERASGREQERKKNEEGLRGVRVGVSLMLLQVYECG